MFIIKCKSANSEGSLLIELSLQLACVANLVPRAFPLKVAWEKPWERGCCVAGEEEQKARVTSFHQRFASPFACGLGKTENRELNL